MSLFKPPLTSYSKTSSNSLPPSFSQSQTSPYASYCYASQFRVDSAQNGVEGSSADCWDCLYPANSMCFNGITHEDDLTGDFTRDSANCITGNLPPE